MPWAFEPQTLGLQIAQTRSHLNILGPKVGTIHLLGAPGKLYNCTTSAPCWARANTSELAKPWLWQQGQRPKGRHTHTKFWLMEILKPPLSDVRTTSQRVRCHCSIYTYICIYIYMYNHVYIYIERERVRHAGLKVMILILHPPQGPSFDTSTWSKMLIFAESCSPQ